PSPVRRARPYKLPISAGWAKLIMDSTNCPPEKMATACTSSNVAPSLDGKGIFSHHVDSTHQHKLRLAGQRQRYAHRYRIPLRYPRGRNVLDHRLFAAGIFPEWMFPKRTFMASYATNLAHCPALLNLL